MKKVALLTIVWLVVILWIGVTIVSAQTVAIEVKFKLLDVKDPRKIYDLPLAGAKVRLVLGEIPNWRSADAGYRFVTDANGEAHFTMEGIVDTRWRSRNVGFTPFSLPSRSDHVFIALELEHEFPDDKNGPPKILPWVLTMDLDCFRDGQCSTVGFMSILTRDTQGNFTMPLERQGGTDSWRVPELNGQVIWGMSYKVADFDLSRADGAPMKYVLTLKLKRFSRQ